MIFIKSNTFCDVYKQLLHLVYFRPEYVTKPRDLEIKECMNVGFEVNNPLYSLYHNGKRSSPINYILDELAWYLTCDRKVDWIGTKASLWKQITDENDLVNSNYGNLLFSRLTPYNNTQFQWAYQSLINDKDTRQAFMHFNDSNHQYFTNKDQVCTLYGIFHIRNNKLNFTIHMRSSDIIFGLATDVAIFCLFQQQMLKLLQEKYTDLELGTYTHISNSLHVYSRHYGLVEEIINDNVYIPFQLTLNSSFIENNCFTLTKNAKEFIKNRVNNTNEINLVTIGE